MRQRRFNINLYSREDSRTGVSFQQVLRRLDRTDPVGTLSDPKRNATGADCKQTVVEAVTSVTPSTVKY